MLARNLRLALAVTTGLCSTAFFAAPVAAQNLPVGASVAGQSGSNAITYGTSGTTGTLNLGDNQRSIINWNSFDVSNGYTMQFQYSGADRGAVLNRVTGGAQSEIYGGR